MLCGIQQQATGGANIIAYLVVFLYKFASLMAADLRLNLIAGLCAADANAAGVKGVIGLAANHFAAVYANKPVLAVVCVESLAGMQACRRRGNRIAGNHSLSGAADGANAVYIVASSHVKKNAAIGTQNIVLVLLRAGVLAVGVLCTAVTAAIMVMVAGIVILVATISTINKVVTGIVRVLHIIRCLIAMIAPLSRCSDRDEADDHHHSQKHCQCSSFHELSLLDFLTFVSIVTF